MPRVLYYARTRPNPEPPYPAPPSRLAQTPAAPAHTSSSSSGGGSPATQLMDLDDQCYYEYESDDLGECPPTPEQPSFDSQDYNDDCFNPYLENVPRYANIALEHYNSQEEHEIKYQLIKAFVSSIIRYDGCCHYHVNFTAKSSLENSKEEFFFAELRRTGGGIWVPVCIVSLEENERVGGFSEITSKGGVDPRHCFGCGDVVKHPVDGSLYEAGHYLADGHFFHKYIEVLPATG